MENKNNDQQEQQVAEENVDAEEQVQDDAELQEELRRLNNSVRNGLGLIFPGLAPSSSSSTSSSESSGVPNDADGNGPNLLEEDIEERFERAQQAAWRREKDEETYYRAGSWFLLLCAVLIVLLAIIALMVLEMVHLYHYGGNGFLVEIPAMVRWFVREMIARMIRFLRSFRS